MSTRHGLWMTALCLTWGAATALAQEGSGEGTGAAVPAASTAAQPAPAEVPIDVESFEVEVSGPEGEVSVGEPVTVTVRVSLPAGVELTTVESIHPGRLEFEDRRLEVTDTATGRLATARIVYVSFRPGTHHLEALELRFQLPDGTSASRRVPGVDVRVRSLIANEQDPALRPAKGGVPVLYRDYTMAWVLGLGGALLSMGLFGFLLARSRPRVIFEPPPPPPRPAHEIALEKLDAITADALIEKGDLMAFNVRLSEAIREYLGNRYRFDGLELTTTEILGELKAVRLPPEHDHGAVRALLYACDLVKFAKGAASESEEREALARAYALVKATMLRAAPLEPMALALAPTGEASPTDAKADPRRVRIEPAPHGDNEA